MNIEEPPAVLAIFPCLYSSKVLALTNPANKGDELHLVNYCKNLLDSTCHSRDNSLSISAFSSQHVFYTDNKAFNSSSHLSLDGSLNAIVSFIYLGASNNKYPAPNQLAQNKVMRCSALSSQIVSGKIKIIDALSMQCNPNSEYYEQNQSYCSIIDSSMLYRQYCPRTTGVPCVY